MSNAHVKCRVLVDFDGTIATVDTTDLLLERFADPRWHDIEEAWKAGEIGSRECMLRQVSLIRATPDEIDEFVASIEIDPDFPAFISLCRDQGLDVLVVSDGIDRTVGAVLARYGLDLPYHANHLEWLGGDRWRLSFPNARSDCTSLAGNCKCQFAAATAGTVRVIVGDGRSDFCVANEAELVLAKGSLVTHCAATGLTHFPISTFAEATPLLGAWLGDVAMRRSSSPQELRDE